MIFPAHSACGPVIRCLWTAHAPVDAHGPRSAPLPPGLALRQGCVRNKVRFWYGNGLCLMSKVGSWTQPVRTPPERPARHKLSQSRTWRGWLVENVEHVKNNFMASRHCARSGQSRQWPSPSGWMGWAKQPEPH